MPYAMSAQRNAARSDRDDMASMQPSSQVLKGEMDEEYENGR